jgi:hypothetical protein
MILEGKKIGVFPPVSQSEVMTCAAAPVMLYSIIPTLTNKKGVLGHLTCNLQWGELKQSQPYRANV